MDTTQLYFYGISPGYNGDNVGSVLQWPRKTPMDLRFARCVSGVLQIDLPNEKNLFEGILNEMCSWCSLDHLRYEQSPNSCVYEGSEAQELGTRSPKIRLHIFSWSLVSINELEKTFRALAISKFANKQFGFSRIDKVCIQTNWPIRPALISGFLIFGPNLRAH